MLASGLCFSRQPRDYGAASRGLLTMRAQVFLWLVLFISTFGMPELVQARQPGYDDPYNQWFWDGIGIPDLPISRLNGWPVGVPCQRFATHLAMTNA